jgi:hypothetical protein
MATEFGVLELLEKGAAAIALRLVGRGWLSECERRGEGEDGGVRSGADVRDGNVVDGAG